MSTRLIHKRPFQRMCSRIIIRKLHRPLTRPLQSISRKRRLMDILPERPKGNTIRPAIDQKIRIDGIIRIPILRFQPRTPMTRPRLVGHTRTRRNANNTILRPETAHGIVTDIQILVLQKVHIRRSSIGTTGIVNRAVGLQDFAGGGPGPGEGGRGVDVEAAAGGEAVVEAVDLVLDD
jgi:hypothetical protein